MTLNMEFYILHIGWRVIPWPKKSTKSYKKKLNLIQAASFIFQTKNNLCPLLSFDYLHVWMLNWSKGKIQQTCWKFTLSTCWLSDILCIGFLAKKRNSYWLYMIHPLPLERTVQLCKGFAGGLSMANKQEKKQDTPSYGVVFI